MSALSTRESAKEKALERTELPAREREKRERGEMQSNDGKKKKKKSIQLSTPLFLFSVSKKIVYTPTLGASPPTCTFHRKVRLILSPFEFALAGTE